jgi:hypothetical protein
MITKLVPLGPASRGCNTPLSWLTRYRLSFARSIPASIATHLKARIGLKEREKAVSPFAPCVLPLCGLSHSL